jgi:hypothetical protein
MAVVAVVANNSAVSKMVILETPSGVKYNQMKKYLKTNYFELQLARIIHGGVDFLEVSGD